MSRRISAIVTSLFAIGSLLLLSAPLAAQSGALPGASGTLWVTDRTTNTVAAYDAATGELLSLIPVGSTPIGVVAPHGTGKVYVSDEGSNTVSVISKTSLSVIKAIPTGPKPHHIGHSPNGKFVYVAEFGTNKVGVIDTSTDTLIAEFAASERPEARSHAVWITSDGKTLLVTNSVVNEIAALDALNGDLLWTLPVGENPSEVLATSNGKIAYVSIRNEDKLQVIDLEQRAIIDEIYVGDQPDTLQLTPDGKSLIIGLRGTPATIAVVDVFKGLSVSWIGLPGTTTGHNWLSANGRYSFVCVESRTLGEAGVAVIDHKTGAYVTTYVYPDPGSARPRPHGIFYEPAKLSQ